MAKEEQESKREKLKGFENWPQWADLTQAMLEEKEIWDIVDGTRPEPTTAVQTRKKDKDNTIASRIIKQKKKKISIGIIIYRNSERTDRQ